MSVGKGETVVSWAHQRTRDLADQILDDAQSLRERCTACTDAVRRAGFVIVDTVLDVPTVCRQRLEAFALASRRRAWSAAEAALDFAWLVGQGVSWMRARPRRIVAVIAAPVVPALALIVALLFGSAEAAPY
jgi:hypothetical protein